MTWVKICGVTNLEDAQAAVEAGADALGFVFYDKSPRYLEPARAQEIAGRLPDSVNKIGVFVDAHANRVREIAEQAAMTGVQIHYTTQNTPEQSAIDRGAMVKPFKAYMALPMAWFLEQEDRLQALTADFVQAAQSMNALPAEAREAFDTILFDSGNLTTPGGTGQIFDWERVAELTKVASKNFKVILAGGLTPENVARAIDILHPWGVDVSSGVEIKPGKKDAGKVRDFISKVRRAGKAA